MKKLWQLIGVASFWLTLPLLGVYLSRAKRTRIAITSGEYLLVVMPWLGNGKWSLPGGGIHRQETPEGAVLRELKEETGIVISKAQIDKIGKYHYKTRFINFDYILYSASLSDRPAPSKQFLEIVDVKWIKLAKLDRSNSNLEVVQAADFLNRR
jgi:8-oxo-dGTP pyrophosphatase MutT (NUDIX family)